MKINILTEKELENYLFDSKLEFGIYLTLTKSKIEKNENHFKEFTSNIVENSYSKYSIKARSFDNNTILTILENGKDLHSQLLVTVKEVFGYLKINDLTPYVNYQVGELILDYFD